VPLETALERRSSQVNHARLRTQILELMKLIAETCPVSEDRTEALLHLDAVAFYTISSLRHRSD
jgi:hypothetical protein